MFNFKLLFAFAVLVQCIMSMKSVEEPVAELIDGPAEAVVPPTSAVEDVGTDQLSAEFKRFGFGYGRPFYGGFGGYRGFGGFGYRPYGFGGFRRGYGFYG